MRWLIENWHHLLHPPWGPVLLAPLAALCGALVGMERERNEKPAGVRTFSMVCLGSAIFTIVGYAFTSTTGDSGRVAAQIVAGIGFLGGGIILRSPSGVHGTTTAATIWAVAATGVVIGAGYAPAGVAATLLILAVLIAVGHFERSHFGGGKADTVTLLYSPENGKTEVKLRLLLEDFAIARRLPAPTDAGNGLRRVTIAFQLTAKHHREFFFTLTDMPEIRGIDY